MLFIFLGIAMAFVTYLVPLPEYPVQFTISCVLAMMGLYIGVTDIRGK